MTTETRDTIAALAADVAIEAAYNGRQKDGDGWEHDAWTVALTYQGRTYPDISYRMGTGHSKPHPDVPVRGESVYDYEKRKAKPGSWQPTPPDAASLIDTLLLDVSSLDQRFESWAADLGYDTDSRKAERIYHECLKVLPMLRALLGSDFERFEQAERL